MRRKARLMMKQLWKYIIIVIVFIVGMLLYRIMWEFSMKIVYQMLAIFGIILLISIIFDWISAKDILPIFGK